MKDTELLDRLVAKLSDLWDRGCPIAGPDGRSQFAALGLRRWQSFERRTKGKHPTTADRLQDLAQRLFEKGQVEAPTVVR